MIRIYFDNFGYYSQHAPMNMDDAKLYCQSKAFDATVIRDGIIIAHYSPFMGGWRNV